MESKADKWFPLYVASYLKKTMRLTTEQHGAYLLLIMACWTDGGRLPNDDGQLAAITKMTLPAWKRAKSVILPFFTPDGDDLIHERVTAEIDRAAKITKARSEAGQQGGRPRKDGSKPKPNAKPNGKQIGMQTETHAYVALQPTPVVIAPTEQITTGAPCADLPDERQSASAPSVPQEVRDEEIAKTRAAIAEIGGKPRLRRVA